ncbi:MAG TPA: DMT family transporter [Aliiroseovarius sp.]|nr:DMT family transporter [Aliiroseovarius sp.]
MAATAGKTRGSTGRAALWMIGSVTSFSAMAVAGREVAVTLDTFELMLYRSLIGVACVVGFGAATGRLGQVSRAHFRLHLARNLAHFTGQNLWFYALTVIPLAQVFALEFTSPLWVALLAPFALGERLTRMRVLAVVLGFIGILVVTRPDTATLNSGTLAAASAAIAFALTAVATRRLTRTDTTLGILFWLTIMQAVFGLVTAGADGHITLPNAGTLPFLLVIGFGGLLAHLCLTQALALAPATVVIPIDFARLPLIALVGALVYGERLTLSLFAGAGLIIVANTMNLRAAARSARVPGD